MLYTYDAKECFIGHLVYNFNYQDFVVCYKRGKTVNVIIIYDGERVYEMALPQNIAKNTVKSCAAAKKAQQKVEMVSMIDPDGVIRPHMWNDTGYVFEAYKETIEAMTNLDIILSLLDKNSKRRKFYQDEYSLISRPIEIYESILRR